MSRTASEREPYKPDNTAQVDVVERRRLELGVSIEDLARQAGIGTRKLMRIRSTGRAWKREIVALRMALRSIERDQAKEVELFGGDNADAGEGGAGRA